MTSDPFTDTEWSIRPFMSIPNIGCRLIHSVDQPIPHGGLFTTLLFDTALEDNGGMHSTSDPSKITIPIAGVYLVGLEFGFAANPNGQRTSQLRVNSAPVIGKDSRPNSGATVNCWNKITVCRYFNLGDFITAEAYQNSGGVLNALSTAGAGNEYAPIFWARLIG